MRPKINDKVILLLSSIHPSIKRSIEGATSGTIIEKCCVRDCWEVKLNNGQIKHLLENWFTLAKTNSQLVFDF